jgi:DNA-binding LytR/AlgR family response regulator
MFKLRVDKERKAHLKKQLNLEEGVFYDYIITDNPLYQEDGKITILFDETGLEKLVNLLDLIAKGKKKFINGHNEFGIKSVDVSEFIFFQVDGDDLVGLTAKTRLLIPLKLYELEAELDDMNFIRINKFTIVNIDQIDYIAPALNARLELKMKNNESVFVNRSYLKAFKAKLKL